MYNAFLMSVRLPLEGDEGMGFDMIYLTWLSLENSTVCTGLGFVHNDVDPHPVYCLETVEQNFRHQMGDFIHM